MRFLLLALISFNLLAEPEYVEIWFLSESKTAINLDLFPVRTIATTAQVPPGTPCTPYGDGCFHPQYGYFEKDSGNKGDLAALEDKKPKSDVKADSISNMNTDLVNCDRNYYFDMFCGKAKPEMKVREKQKLTKLEVWLDTSSSFRLIDPTKDGQCYRGSLMKRLRDQCGGNVSFSVFDTGKREVSQASVACDSVGLNDTDRIIRWIDNNESKTLIVVTDIHEYNMKLADYLETINAKIRGEIPRAEFVSGDLLSQVDRLKKLCR